MNVKEAVKDKMNYADIVAWFRSMGDLDAEQLVLLADTIDAMSEEVYEHYRALCDIMKGQLQRIRRICQDKDVKEAFPEDPMRAQLFYAVARACAQKAVLPEKYEELMLKLKNG